MKRFIPLSLICLSLLFSGCGQSSQSSGPEGQSRGPALGSKSAGPTLDKSDDAALQQLIKDVAPKFRANKFSSGDKEMEYSLFAPTGMAIGKKYPLVVFMADASTAGRELAAPLTQGYGALVFATPEAQAKNPCFVLAPQFSGVAVNDDYARTGEVDLLPALIEHVIKQNAIDPARIYATGQSMGGMIAMYLNSARPGLFAASLFVDSHWDAASFDSLVKNPFIMTAAGESGKAAASEKAIEEACRKMGVSYTTAEWSAKLPLATQDDLAKTMLEKGAPVNLFTFENGTVIPENKQGSEHMWSFDAAYKIAPLRDWLFSNSLRKK